jgi:hypothetical protein
MKRAEVGWRKPSWWCKMAAAPLATREGMTKPPRGASGFWRNLHFELFDRRRNRTDNPFGGRRNPPVADGREAWVTANHLWLSDPGRHEDPDGRRPDDLRHPGPLTRGADRGACGQHERPVEGPAATAADPTAGCGVSGDGCGYPDHVGTFLLAKGCSAGFRTPTTRSVGHVAPPGLPRPVDGATLF